MPNGKYFGGAPNAFAGGMAWRDDRRQREYADNALRSLIERFGPEAALPQFQAQLQTTQQAGQLFPYQMSAVRRDDAAHRANVAQYGVTAGSPQAHGIQQQEQQRQYSTALAAARGLQHTLSRGGDVGASFDRLNSYLTAIGETPERITAMREAIMENPEEAIPELMAMLQGFGQGGDGQRGLSGGQPMYNRETGELEWVIPMADGSYRVVEGYEPANPALAEGRLGLANRRFEWDRESHFLPTPQQGVQSFEMPDGRVVSDVVPGSPQERELVAEIREAQGAARTAIRTNSGILAAGRTVTRDGRRALARLGADITPMPGEDDLPRAMRGLPMHMSLYRMLSSKVWGTSARRLERNIQSVMDNISIDKLLEIKAQDAGLGHVPDKQLERLASVLGRLKDLDRPIPELIRDMEEVLWRYEEIMQYAQIEIDEAENFLRQPQGTSSGFGPQPRPSASFAPPPGIAAPPGQGQPPTPTGQVDPQEIIAGLRAQGLDDEAIIARLREMGVVR